MYCLGCSNDEGRESGGVQGIRGERAKEEEGGEKRRRLREKARVEEAEKIVSTRASSNALLPGRDTGRTAFLGIMSGGFLSLGSFTRSGTDGIFGKRRERMKVLGWKEV